jgi:hypothetical protein
VLDLFHNLQKINNNNLKIFNKINRIYDIIRKKFRVKIKNNKVILIMNFNKRIN